MSVLLQLSDPHFGTERPAAVEALVALARDLRPDVTVLSGDITQRGRRSQFRQAARFTARLPGPLLAIPGNHDIPLFNLPLRWLAPYANYKRAYGNVLEPEFASPDFLVLCLNTTRVRYRKDGAVSAAQIARVAARLRRASHSQLRVVVTHQPVHVIRPHDLENLLHGHEAAVRAWAEAGADVVMGGHIHLPYFRPLRERFPDLPREVWSIQAGTALSTRVRDDKPNSVNVLRYDAGQPLCTVERWDFDAPHARFVCASLDRMTLARPVPAAGHG